MTICATTRSVRFSVVIDSYNYGRFLSQAIDSCLAQTHPAHEIIVVDDGSTDNSREILAGYRDNPRVKIILQENQGQAAALQHGIDAATGDWILGLDSDDCYHPDCLEEIARHTRPGIDWVYFRATKINAAGEPIMDLLLDPRISLLQGWIWKEWIMAGKPDTFPPQSFHCYSARFLKRMRLHPNPQVDVKVAMAPDRYLNLHAAFDCQAAAIERPLGLYREHASHFKHAIQQLPAVRVKLWQQDIADEIVSEKLRALGIPDRPSFCVYPAFEYWPERLISLVCDPDTHPYPQDRRLTLLRHALSAYLVKGQIRPKGLLWALVRNGLVILVPRRSAWQVYTGTRSLRTLILRRLSRP